MSKSAPKDKCKYRCPRCKNPFLRKNDLADHIKNVKCEKRLKSDKVLPQFVCICDATFDIPYCFARHQEKCKVIEYVNKQTMNTLSLKNASTGHNINGDSNALTDNSVHDNSVHNTTNVFVQYTFPDNLSMPVMPYTIPCPIRIVASGEMDPLSKFKINPYLIIFRITHCNPHNQLYHNIYYSQNGGNKLSVYNGIRWEVKKAHIVIRDIISVHRKDYKKFFHDIANFTPVAIKEKMMHYINLFDPEIALSKKEVIEHDKMLEEIHRGILSLLTEYRPLIEQMYLRTNIVQQLSSESDSSDSSESEEPKKSKSISKSKPPNNKSDSDSSEFEAPKKSIKKNNVHKKHIKDDYDHNSSSSSESESLKKSTKKKNMHKKHIEYDHDSDSSSSSSSESESPKKKSTTSGGINFESSRKEVNNTHSSSSESDSAEKKPVKKCNKKTESKSPKKKSTSDSESETPKRKSNKK